MIFIIQSMRVRAAGSICPRFARRCIGDGNIINGKDRGMESLYLSVFVKAKNVKLTTKSVK